MTTPGASSTTGDDPLHAARIAVERNMITPEQLEECVVIAHQVSSAGLKKDVYDVLVEKGYISRKILNAIFVSIGKALAEIGHYEILSRLGEGGMGTVYKVRHKTNGQIYALKTLKRDLARDREHLERFMREIRNSFALSHPNIIRAADMGVDKETHFYVMEYIEGESLESLMKKRKRLGEEESARIIAPIAEALAFANSRGIVHRDIKPANVLISKEGIVKLCDMGIAKSVGTDVTLTQTGTAVGSPHYISPEQVTGTKDLDIRSDIYSLGVTLYYMVTGKLPFDDPNPHTLISMRLTEDPPHPSTCAPDLSPEMGTLIMRMMARDLRFRIRTPEEVASRLTAIAKGIKSPPRETTPKHIKTTRNNARSPVARRYIPLGLAAAGVIVLVAMLLMVLPRKTENDKPPVLPDKKAVAIETSPDPAALRLKELQEWQRQAEGSYSAGKYEEVMVFTAKALEIDPSFAEAVRLKSDAEKALAKRRNEEGRQLLEQAVKKLVADDRKGAAADCEKAIALDPSLRNEAEALLRKIEPPPPTDPLVEVRNLMRTAETLIEQGGKESDAIDLYTRVIKLQPGNAEAYHRRGQLKAETDDRSGAFNDLSKAIDLNPRNAVALIDRGALSYKMMKYKEAIADCNKANEIDPSLPLIFYNRGAARYKLKDYKGALADWEQAIKLNPLHKKSLQPKIDEIHNFLRDEQSPKK